MVSRLGSPINVSDHVLKIWIELIKSLNDNTMEKFYRLLWFPKFGVFFYEIPKIWNVAKIMKKCQ